MKQRLTLMFFGFKEIFPLYFCVFCRFNKRLNPIYYTKKNSFCDGMDKWILYKRLKNIVAKPVHVPKLYHSNHTSPFNPG